MICGTSSGHLLNNELIKMSAEGNILWTKKISEDVNFKQVLPISDGYILSGIKQDEARKFLFVSVKTDLSGNVIWSQIYQDKVRLENSGNTIQDGNAFIAAGLIRAHSNVCSICDSVSIIKFNASGTVLKRTNILALGGTFPVSAVYVSKMSNGEFVVAASNTKALYTFSDEFKPLLRTNVIYDITHLNTTAAGEVVLLQQGYDNGLRVMTTGLDHNGVSKWQYLVDGTQFLSNGFSCCANSWAIKTYPLKKGGSIFIADEVGDNSSHRVIVTKIGNGGGLM